MAAPGAAPVANPQGLIDKYAAQTQSKADDAIVNRVETSIKHSPMGWLQSQMGEVDARASSEGSEVNGKVAESRDIIAKNQAKAPPEAGPAPKAGPAAHPAVPHPTAGATAAGGSPKPAEGGQAAPPAHAPAQSIQAAAAAPAVAGEPAKLQAELAMASGDPQIDAILNAYTPKSEEAPASMGRIRQMGDVAKGFSGQLEVYVAGSNKAEQVAAGAANFLGVGKEAGAVWANNPYRQMHTSLSGIMAGLSAVKNVANVVGSVCGKIGLVLTVVGLLGMIFPPVGAAVSGIARILNVVSVICDAVGFVMSAILTGMNAVQLAQQIASGASAEEKAATADMLMSETLDASNSLFSVVTDFGGGFMKGLLSSSKGVVGTLMKRARAVIGNVVSKISTNVKSVATRVFRKMGLGGVNAERSAAGGWVTKAAKPGIPERLQGFQDKLMAKYGDTGWAKRLDRVGAWSSSQAQRFDLEEKITKAGERSGAKVSLAGADSSWAKNFNKGTEKIEADTRASAARVAAADAGDLERQRWENLMQRKRDGGDVGAVSPEKGDAFAAQQGARVEKADMDAFGREERGAKGRLNREAKADAASDAAVEDTRDKYAHGEDRAETVDKVHELRDRRATLETKYAGDDKRREALRANPARTGAEDTELRHLDGRLDKLDKVRAKADASDEQFSRVVGTGEDGQRRMNNWGDVGFNVKSVYKQVKEQRDDTASEEAQDRGLEYVKKHASVGNNAEGEAVSMEGSRNEVTSERAHALAAFVTSSPRPGTLGTRVRARLANTGKEAPTTGAPAKGPPSAGPQGPGVVAAGAQVAAVAPAPVAPTPAAAPAPAPAPEAAAPAADLAGGADALPYWPALLPQFQSAASDFEYMRKVGVEFKKAQIEGKQKAVNTLGIYGKYNEYAKLRAQQAQQHASGAHQTAGETAANQEHAGSGTTAAGQGEQKQGEAKTQASNRAAVDLPEPETSGFWGSLLGGIKIWARNKAASVMGWIQDKIASLILEGLCGISMGDLRDYTGALRRQQAASHGVAEGAGEKSTEAGQKQIKLSGDANQASQDAVKDIAECDSNLVDADAFLADVTSFEGQLAEEKVNAQLFLAQVHAAAKAEQDKAKQAAAAQAIQDAHAAAPEPAAPATSASAPGPAAAAPGPVVGEEPDAAAGAPARDEGATEDIHSAVDMVGEEGEAMAKELETRAEDYLDDLAVADSQGRGAHGEDLRKPAKEGGKQIVHEFQRAVEESKHELGHLTHEQIDPSSARKIADSVIQAAEHLDMTFGEAQRALDQLFSRTYGAIRDGREKAAADAKPAAGPAAAAKQPAPAAPV